MSLQTSTAFFRAQLLRRDEAAANAMLRAYGSAWRVIKADLDNLVRRIEQMEAAGEFINPTVVARELRLQTLLRDAESQINTFARLANARVKAEQRTAIDAARKSAEALFFDQLPSGVNVSFAQIPKKALSELVGAMGDGSPLEETFRTFGAGAKQIIQTELTSGLIAGKGVRAIAGRIRDQLGGQLERALTITRTEVLRAYREASIQTYQANDDVVKGWRWTASLSTRTCAMCLSMDGSIHPVTESFNSHPRCRCVPVGISKSWRESGIPIDEPKRHIQTGEDWFDKQSSDRQRAILGNAAFKAYQAGSVKLSDFIGEKNTLQWGKTRYTRSLTEILGERAERFKKAA